jgi:hypothetical protein
MPKALNPDAPVPTYKIDRIVEENDELKKIHGGHSHYLVSSARAFRNAFNLATQAAIDDDASIKAFSQRKAKTEYVFQELRRVARLLDTTDAATISAVAVPVELTRPPYVSESDIERTEDAFADLRASITSFLITIELPSYRCAAGGNHDRMTHRFIRELAGDGRLWPFTPVTRANFRPFARLLAAGWEDVGLPRAVRPRGGAGLARSDGTSYHSVYGWLSDRVRTQLGFRSFKKPIQNPKRFPGPQRGRT